MNDLCTIFERFRCYQFTVVFDTRENDFGMRLMRNDLWNDLRKRHKAYRHPAKVRCIHTIERSKSVLKVENVKIVELKNVWKVVRWH